MLAKCPDAILIGNIAEDMGMLREDLQSRECISLTKEKKSWDIIAKLDGPIDLCKKCTYRRKKLVSWKLVEEKTKPEEWFVEH